MSATPPFGPGTALLIIHLQPDIVRDGTAFGSLFAAEVDRTDVVGQSNRAAEALRGAGGTVIATRIAFSSDGRDLNPSIPLLRMAQEAGALINGTEGANFVPELHRDEADLELVHQRPGPFSGTALDTWLRDRGIDTVVLAGVATNASVESAVRQSSDLGYRTYILTDASSAADEATHNAALASMDLFAGRLTVGELSGLSG